mgnify:CR=1 FL=1|jgi:hypothetical protein|nr:MAG TPA: hypothetical protein [Caudoviricetes sp.]
MKVFYGKKVHIVATIIGIAVSTYAVYWLGRSDEVQQIVDLVEDQGSITMTFHNLRTGKGFPIHMYSD